MDFKDKYPKATNLVTTRYELSKKYVRPYFERFIENYKHYLATLTIPSGQQYPFDSEMVIPISFQIVETVLPRMIGKDPEFTVTARDPKDVKVEDVWRHLIHYQYQNPALTLLGEPIYLKLYEILKEALITGTGIGFYYWRREIKPKVKYEMGLKLAGIDFGEKAPDTIVNLAKKIGAKPNWRKKTVEERVIDDPDLQYVPIWKFYPDPTERSLGRQRWGIIRDEVSFDMLVAEAKINGYEKSALQEAYKMMKRDAGEYESERFEKDFKDLFGKDDYTFEDTTNPKIERLMMWEDNRFTVVVGRKVCLRDGENPFDFKRKPIFAVKDIPIPGEFYGWGEIDPIKKLEDGMTDIMNMRFDNIARALMKMWLINPDLVIDEDEFVPMPDGLVHVRDINNAAREMPVSDVTSTAYAEAREIYSIIQGTSGVTDYAKGVEGRTLVGRTVGGLRLLQEAANARFALKMRLFEHLALKVVGNAFLELDKQFITKDRVIRITGDYGEKLIKVSPEKLRTNVGYLDLDVVTNSSEAVDKQFEILKWNAIVDRIGKPPFDMLPREIMDKVAVKFWEAYGIKEAPIWMRLMKVERKKTTDEMKKMVERKKKEQMKMKPISAPIMTGGGQITETPVDIENELRRAENEQVPETPIDFSQAGKGQIPGMPQM